MLEKRRNKRKKLSGAVMALALSMCMITLTAAAEEREAVPAGDVGTDEAVFREEAMEEEMASMEEVVPDAMPLGNGGETDDAAAPVEKDPAGEAAVAVENDEETGDVAVTAEKDGTAEGYGSDGNADMLAAQAGDVIAYGVSGNIVWLIDGDGKLTVSGRGDYERNPDSAEALILPELWESPWYQYREYIHSAEVNVSGMTNASYMFLECTNLVDINIRNFDTSNVTDMTEMFNGCGNLTSLDVTHFDTGNVLDMTGMFGGCSSLTKLDVSNFNTGNVTDMLGMFAGCSNLTNLDVTHFDTSNVLDMSGMFQGCSSLTNLDVSHFDTKNVSSSPRITDVSGGMDGMFWGCSNLTSLDVSHFDTTNVISMYEMFSGCSKLTSLDVSNFVMTNVYGSIGKMFWGCNNLISLDLSNFDLSWRVDNDTWGVGGDDMLTGCNSLQILHTPKAVAYPITLPATYIDTQGNYTGEITSAFTSTILTKACNGQTTPEPPDSTQPQPSTGPATSTQQPPAGYTGWWNGNGQEYWYERGIKQGTEGRGKEIYDPATDAWYWLDAVSGGAKAKNKDVYQESNGGKWVRYDENGRMVKGEHCRDGAWYYFEPVTGAMVKGPVTLEDGRRVFYNTENGQMLKGNYTINNQRYRFDEKDGDLRRGQYDKFWVQIDGKDYWYENWQRQGWNPALPSYRGKEIYDPVTNAWYWLDNLYQGAKAAGKDVYQESRSAYPDRLDGTGKWVRYDIHGRMVKGWHYTPAGTWYFEPVTGSMAKGRVTIDGREYYFDEVTGVRR